MSWKPRLFYLSVIAALSVSMTSVIYAQDAKPAEKKAIASDSANQETTKPVAEEIDSSQMTFEEISKDFADRTRAFRAHRRSLPRAEKRKDKTKAPSANDYQVRLTELINEDPGSQVGLDAVDWWVKNGGRARHMDVILGLVMKNYSKLESINKYVPYFPFYLPEDPAEKYLRELLENNPSDVIKGNASFQLHEMLGKRLKKLDGEKAASVEAEIKTLNDSIYNDYPDVADAMGSNLVARLDSVEFAKKLRTGQPVPDIVGTDVDGVEFKLSDYNGKVRVLTFWGHW